MTIQSMIACSILTVVLMLPSESAAAKHWSTPRKRTLVVRLLAEGPRARMTSFGLNAQQFIAETADGHRSKLIKLVYEYLYYEPPLTGYPMDATQEYRV